MITSFVGFTFSFSEASQKKETFSQIKVNGSMDKENENNYTSESHSQKFSSLKKIIYLETQQLTSRSL